MVKLRRLSRASRDFLVCFFFFFCFWFATVVGLEREEEWSQGFVRCYNMAAPAVVFRPPKRVCVCAYSALLCAYLTEYKSAFLLRRVEFPGNKKKNIRRTREDQTNRWECEETKKGNVCISKSAHYTLGTTLQENGSVVYFYIASSFSFCFGGLCLTCEISLPLVTKDIKD